MKVRNLFTVCGRVTLVTPKKGDKGDMCDETQVGLTDIPSILHRYAGNLEELMKWRGNLRYEDTTLLPRDYTEAYEIFNRAEQAFVNLKDNPFGSLDEAYQAYKEGKFFDAFSKKPTVTTVDDPLPANKSEVNNETTKNNSEVNNETTKNK